MIIDEQIKLFFKKIREPQDNSTLTEDDALEYINDSRRSIADETKFYDVKDKVTADGGETYFTLLNTFLGLQNARDSVTRNGYPIVIKHLANWASLTSNGVIRPLAMNETWGMLHGNTFYVHPPAEAGDEFVWWGSAEPPALPAVTGPDVYLNNVQAELTVLDAAINALEDLNEAPGPVLVARYKTIKKSVSKKPPMGPRLENAPNGY